MNDILLKVQTYLDKSNKESIEISDTLVEEFGEACKSALRKQFSEKRKEGFKPRMSSIGRPLCQLQMEAKNVKGEGQPYNVKMRNTFGDLIEALAIFVMKSAGVIVKDEQKKLNLNLKNQKLKVGLMLRLMKKCGILKVHHHIHLIESLEVGLKKLQKTMRLDMYLKDIFIVKVRRCLLVDGL